MPNATGKLKYFTDSYRKRGILRKERTSERRIKHISEEKNDKTLIWSAVLHRAEI